MFKMIGAIIGDIAGSEFEFQSIKSKDFLFFSKDSDYTDDSLMTLAVGLTLDLARKLGKEDDEAYLRQSFTERMQSIGRKFPDPKGTYGSSFYNWIFENYPQPYNSWGNGSAMRVAACGELATSLKQAIFFGKQSALITHNHPEGIKGAEAVAGAVYLAKIGKDKDAIQAFIYDHYYPEHLTLDEIRPTYYFDPSCQGTVPQSLAAFFEATSFEDAIRNTVSLGGDADTMGAITGSVAWPYFIRHGGLTEDMETYAKKAIQYLPIEFRSFLKQYESALTIQIQK